MTVDLLVYGVPVNTYCSITLILLSEILEAKLRYLVMEIMKPPAHVSKKIEVISC